MHSNDAISQNESVINDLIIRIYKVVLLLMPVLLVLKAMGILASPWIFVSVATAKGVLFCLIPILYRQLRMDVKMQKHLHIACSVVLISIAYGFFHFAVVLLWLLPIGFSCLYFDRKLIKLAAGLTLIFLLISELLYAYFGQTSATGGYTVYLTTAAYAVQIAILAALFLSIAQRAEQMLQGTHGLYENINDLFSNAYVASQSLQQSGEKLAASLEELEAERQEGEGENIDEDSHVGRFVLNLNRTVENAREIMKYTYAMAQAHPQEEKTEEGIRTDWQQMEEYTRKSKQVLAELAGYTGKIKEDLGMIAVIIEESQQLSANAAKEVEEASQGGEGSVILGLRVGELADESVKSAAHIQEVLDGIINDADITISAITETYEDTIKQLELINRTVETLMKWVMYKNMH